MRRLKYNSPVVLTYAIVSFAALVLNALSAGWTNAYLFSVYRCSLLDPLALVRLFGHVIGHADLSHYTGNFMMILLLGPALEEKYGSRKLLRCILATALVTGAVHTLLSPDAALLGASGIVFMMIVMSSCTGFKDGQIPVTLLLILVIYLGDQIVTGIAVRDTVSQLGHIVGGICGMVFGLALPGGKGGSAGKKTSREEEWLKTGKL